MDSPVLQKAKERTLLSDKYLEYTKELIEIKKYKALNWPLIRSEVNSDTQAERKWQATEKGQKEIELTLITKAFEKQLSALKGEQEALQGQARNHF